MTRPRPATVARVAAAAASGALLALSRPPFDLGPLACVALVPLFVAWRGRTPRGAAGLAFVSGVAYYGALCSWIWYFGAIAIVPFSVAVAAYWAAAGAVIGWLRTRAIALIAHRDASHFANQHDNCQLRHLLSIKNLFCHRLRQPPSATRLARIVPGSIINSV